MDGSEAVALGRSPTNSPTRRAGTVRLRARAPLALGLTGLASAIAAVASEAHPELWCGVALIGADGQWTVATGDARLSRTDVDRLAHSAVDERPRADLASRPAWTLPLRTPGGAALGAMVFVGDGAGAGPPPSDVLAVARLAAIAVAAARRRDGPSCLRGRRLRARLAPLHEPRRRQADAMASADRLLATLAHELRNPVAAVRASLQILEQRVGTEDPGIRHILGMMRREVDGQSRLVADLLEVAVAHEGRQPVLHRQALDLAVVVERAHQTFAQRAGDGGICLAVHVPEAPVVVSGDPDRLSQVINNLLDNALKFSPARATVCVRLTAGARDAIVRVTDQGRGIPPADLSRVFDLYFQGDAGIATGSRGVGIGLALARELVEAHGGHIRAASRGEGQGTTFTVRLPLLVPLQADAPREVAT